MSDRKNTRSYAPNMEAPGRRQKSSGRGKLGIALSFLLPPAGIAFLWRRGIFRTRGRVLVTVFSTLWMAVILALILPGTEVLTISPAPAVPAAATVAPNDGIVTALSNIDQLLEEQMAAEAALNPTVEPEMTDAEAEAARLAEQEAILNTTVYSVFNNAKYYHSREVCGTQSNRRSLTVREAMNEAMGACSNCNPPVYTG